MKVIAINLQVPKWVDDYFKGEAKTRMTSKSSVLRQVLVDHVRIKQSEAESEQAQTAKAA